MQSKLKDPDSLKLKDVRVCSDDGVVFCGKVNAKNSYGGYTGYYAFTGSLLSKEVAYVMDIDSDEPSISYEMCRESGIMR
jgi:hypothetical protein